VDDDFFIIQFLSIYLADMARAWLDHLRRHSIDCWEDLKEIITGNFQGTLSQKQGESLWDYIRCFSQKCHELPKICDGDFILAFWFKMNCQTLVNELGRDQPKTMKELLNNATRAMGKQALVMVEGRHSERLARALRGEPMVTIGAPKMMGGGAKRQPQQVTVTTSYNEGDDDKEASDSNEEHIAVAECDFKHQAWKLINHFEKLIEATYPNHVYPAQHKLMECTMMKNYMTTMMKNYMTTGTFTKGKRRSCRSTIGLPPMSPGVSSNLQAGRLML
jgi:hypothetical protein